jgi:predicted DNA-binding transcriptional regulator AlpA
MAKSATLKVTLIAEEDEADALLEGQLTESQKEVIRLAAREAVKEYIRETQRRRVESEQNAEEAVLPDAGFVRLPQILKVIPLGKTCWWEGVRAGRFPRPVKLSGRCTAWRAEDIRELVKKLSKQSRRE